VEGRTAAAATSGGGSAATRWSRWLLTTADEHTVAVVAGIWLVWFGAVILTVEVGIAAGVYKFVPIAWTVHTGPWPLFSWDYSLYDLIARVGYPAGTAARDYAFFPLWPLVLRASGSVSDAVVAGTLAWIATAAAFAGVAAGEVRARWRAALALACWPGSCSLALAYPDGVALAGATWAAALALRGRSLAAGVLGVVAATARPNGALIALPLAWLARGRGVTAWIGAAAPIAALLAVQGYFWEHSGDPTAFFEAQRTWGRIGPRRVGGWLDHVGAAIGRHGLLIGLLLAASVVLVAVVSRRFGPWATTVVAYACVVPVLLAGTQSLEGFLDSVRAALVLPLLVVLWRLGPRYRPWAAFATVVVVLLLTSGLMQSFGRQSLFAFPIFWAIADGPRWLRYPPLAALGFASNLGLALLFTRFAP
jgi:hypothetical protein